MAGSCEDSNERSSFKTRGSGGGGVLYQPSYYQFFKRSLTELVTDRTDNVNIITAEWQYTNYSVVKQNTEKKWQVKFSNFVPIKIYSYQQFRIMPVDKPGAKIHQVVRLDGAADCFPPPVTAFCTPSYLPRRCPEDQYSMYRHRKTDLMNGTRPRRKVYLLTVQRPLSSRFKQWMLSPV